MNSSSSSSSSSSPPFLMLAKSQSAFEDGFQERAQPKLTTLLKDLDIQLGGDGFLPGKVVEIYGAPGTGRTQFVLQLAANCHIPARFNGLDGEALFIDTEGSFSGARLGEIAAGLEDGYGVERGAVLAGTHVLHAASWAELLAGVYALPRLLAARPRVRLVVVDSITFPMHAADPSGNRTRSIAAMMQFLCRVAYEWGLVVAVTNHLTTRVDGTTSLQVPSLGEGFGHSSTYRLRFFWSHLTRCIEIDKTPVITDSATGPRVPIAFAIEQSGLKSVDIKA